MGLDIDRNLEPTISFFESLLGKDIGKTLMYNHPALLKCSLSKRLIPRRAIMIAKGITFDEKNTKKMCYLTNEKFEVLLKLEKQKQKQKE